MYIFYGCMPDESQFIILSVDELKENKNDNMEHADARELRWRGGRYFYFRFTSAILFFTVIIIYLCRTYVLWIGRPEKCRYSRWNFTDMLFLSEDISISGLQAPFCFFSQ